MTKRKAPTKIKAPIDAKTQKQLDELPKDSFCSNLICLHLTRENAYLGESSIPRKDFDRLVRWYMTGKAR